MIESGRFYMLTSSAKARFTNQSMSFYNNTIQFDWPSFCVILMCAALILVSVKSPAEAQRFRDANNAQLARGETNDGCARLVGGSPRNAAGEPEEFGDELAEICGPVIGGGTGPTGNATGGSGASAVTQVVEERLREIRKDEENEEADGDAINAVDLGTRISLWISTKYQDLDRDTTSFEDGYDSDIWGVTVGAEFLVKDSWIAGMAFAYNYWDGDFDSDGNFETNIYSPIVYTSFFPWEDFFVDAVLSYKYNDVSIDRLRTYVNEADDVFGGKVSADPDEHQVNLGILLGYDYPIRQFTIGPRLAIDYGYTYFDSYAESGRTGLELRYDSDTKVSLQSKLGLQTSMAISTAIGVLVPQVSADWIHEYADDQRSISVQYVQDNRDNPAKFSFESDNPDRNFFEINAGASIVLPYNVQAFANYYILAGHDLYDNQTITGGLRVSF